MNAPRRFRLTQTGTAQSGQAQTIFMPANASGVAPCSCSDLSIAWSDGSTSAAAIAGDAVLPTLVANGTICADTVWTISSAWEPEAAGDAPEVTQVGASAWSVTAPASGVLTLTASAVCGGQTINAGSVTLTIIEGAVYSGGGGSWVEISTLGVTWEAIGAPSMTRTGATFADTQLQQVVPSIDVASATIGYRPHGLDAAVGAVYARLRVRIASFDASGEPYDGYACGVTIPGTTSVTSTVTELGPVKLSDLVIVGGADSSGDQLGSFSFEVDVEVFTP